MMSDDKDVTDDAMDDEADEEAVQQAQEKYPGGTVMTAAKFKGYAASKRVAT